MNPATRRIVTFDAAFTLLHPWPSVGHVYARVAALFGIRHAPDLLNQRFRTLYRSHLEAARKTGNSSGVFSDEETARDWWLALCRDVICPDAPGGAAEAPHRLTAAADAIYDEFARGRCWRLYEDAVPTLEALASRGHRLAVVSNWDRRLLETLADLGIADRFDLVGVSTLLGFEKPDARIFLEVARRLQAKPSELIHVGDSLAEDVAGARAAGADAVWLRRDATTAGGLQPPGEFPPEGASVISNLRQLLAVCGPSDQ